MHLLLGLAIVLMATVPVLVPLAFTGSDPHRSADVVALAPGAGVPALPQAAPAPGARNGIPGQAAPVPAGRLVTTTSAPTPSPTATPTPAPPPSPASPSRSGTGTTTDATSGAPAPDPTTPDPTAEAKVFAAEPNLVVVSLSWEPTAPGAGQPVLFSAVVRNAGSVPTAEQTHGVAFSVDGTEVTWSESSTASLAPGEERTYTADGGVTGPIWSASTGAHTVEARVDDTGQIPELNEDDNTATAALVVG
jgi:hypothetical protein